MHRLIAGLVLWIAIGSAAAQEQRPAFPISHHGDVPPDYGLELMTPALRRPLPPYPPPAGLARLHHDDAPPRYPGDGRSHSGIALPLPPPGRPPAVVRGLFLNGWVFGSARFDSLVRLADTTEINAFVIDVKDASGYLTYRSGVPTAIEIGANAMARAPDVTRRLRILHERGIYPIARIVVARDPLLARRKPEWAVHDRRGGLWHDGLGEPWVDASHDSVWIYAAELATEAVVLGFAELQFDYVRFPDEPAHRMANAVFISRRPGESQRSIVSRQVAMLRERLKPLGVPFTLDVFGLTTSAEGDMGIGQYWEDLVRHADVLLPMVYPSHYRRGAFGLAHPNSEPYAVVRQALADGLRRSADVPNAARIRPYLQAFTLGRPRYTALEVRAQIEAAQDLGLTDWILWNARGVYPAGALRPKQAPAYTAPASNQR
jgi:hypothetical protein